jgi:hypothetical protein
VTVLDEFHAMTIIFSEYASDEVALNDAQEAIERKLTTLLEVVLTFPGSSRLKINVLSRGGDGKPKLVFSGTDKIVAEARKRWDGWRKS